MLPLVTRCPLTIDRGAEEEPDARHIDTVLTIYGTPVAHDGQLLANTICRAWTTPRPQTGRVIACQGTTLVILLARN